MLRLLLVLSILLPALPASAQPVVDGRVDYVIKRDGDPIGTLTMDFRRTGGRLTVTSSYLVEVGLIGIVLYRYDKRMVEIYENGRLVAYETTIDDNGDRSQVRVERTGDRLTVDHPDGSFTAPLGLYVSTYWPPETVRQNRLIDSSEGVLLDVTVTGPVEETLDVDGRTVAAKRYRMGGDLDRELWYAAADGAWLRMRMTGGDGSTIDIERDWPPLQNRE